MFDPDPDGQNGIREAWGTGITGVIRSAFFKSLFPSSNIHKFLQYVITGFNSRERK